jgi:uncharacterized protein YukE
MADVVAKQAALDNIGLMNQCKINIESEIANMGKYSAVLLDTNTWQSDWATKFHTAYADVDKNMKPLKTALDALQTDHYRANIVDIQGQSNQG